MKATNLPPVKFLRGSPHGKQSKYYARVLNGQQIWQRKPVRKRPPTEQELARQQKFVKDYGFKGHPDFTKGRHPPDTDQ